MGGLLGRMRSFVLTFHIRPVHTGMHKNKRGQLNCCTRMYEKMQLNGLSEEKA